MPEGMVGYDEDLYLWSQQQAAALREAARRGVNLPVDWENVAEEIESLGRSDRRGITSRLETIMVHLLKLEHSLAPDPRNGWIRTVERTREDAESLLRESPSLRAQLPEMLAEAAKRAMRYAAVALEDAGEHDAARQIKRTGIRYTVEDVLGDWLPPGP
jgi:hypothetical protein